MPDAVGESPPTTRPPAVEAERVVAADGRRPRVALCLSGGGLRATFFHLGVVRFLYESGLLCQAARGSVTDIFSVSGGSILASHMAANWENYSGDAESFKRAAGEVVAFGRSNIRGAILRRLALPWLSLAMIYLTWRELAPGTLALSGLSALAALLLLFPVFKYFGRRTKLLERRYKVLLGAHWRGFWRSPGLDVLNGNGRPRVHILATSLTSGEPCWFTATGLARHDPTKEEQGSPTELGPLASSLALATTASSAFPPFFPPVRLRGRDLGGNIQQQATFGEIYLADGGVFDSLGVDAVRRGARREPFAEVILSDASSPFDWKVDGIYHVAARTARSTDILMRRVALGDRASAHQDKTLGRVQTLRIRRLEQDPYGS